MIIGIMGKVGSGKTLATRYLSENYNATIISCDEVAKELIEKGVCKKIEVSPLTFFNDEEALSYTREHIHKKVFEKIFDDILSVDKIAKNELYVIETALPNDYYIEKCDKTIYIGNNFNIKKKRLNDERSYTELLTYAIYNSQKYYEKYYEKADFSIINDKTKDDLYNELKKVMDKIIGDI